MCKYWQDGHPVTVRKGGNDITTMWHACSARIRILTFIGYKALSALCNLDHKICKRE